MSDTTSWVLKLTYIDPATLDAAPVFVGVNAAGVVLYLDQPDDRALQCVMPASAAGSVAAALRLGDQDAESE